MKVAVDISLYPLDADFIPPIKDVIERLNSYPGLQVETNPMSTQVRGEYAEVMMALTAEIGTTPFLWIMPMSVPCPAPPRC